MRNFIIVLAFLCFFGAQAQISVTKDGYARVKKKPQETTMSNNDTLNISKVDGIIRGIALVDFKDMIFASYSAFDIPITDSGNNYTQENIEGALIEIAQRTFIDGSSFNGLLSQTIDTAQELAGVVDNIDGTDDQTATEVPFTPYGDNPHTTVQAAMNWLIDREGSGVSWDTDPVGPSNKVITNTADQIKVTNVTVSTSGGVDYMSNVGMIGLTPTDVPPFNGKGFMYMDDSESKVKVSDGIGLRNLAWEDEVQNISNADLTVTSGTRSIKTGVTAVTQFLNGSDNPYFTLDGGSLRPIFNSGIQLSVGPSQNDDAVRLQDLEAVQVPTGGTTGQVLAKASNTDNDVEWVNQSGGSSPTTDYITHTIDIAVTSTHVTSGLAKVINRSVTDTINYTLEDSDLVKNDRFIAQALAKPSIVTIDAATQNSIFLGIEGDTGTRVTAREGDMLMLERINTTDSIAVYCQICEIDSPTALGPEIVGNVVFDDSTFWTFLTEDGPNSPSGGVVRLLSTDGGNSYITKSSLLTTSTQYRLTYEVVANVNGGLTTDGGAGIIPSTVGTHTVDFTASQGNFSIKRDANVNGGNVDITIDNVSLKEIL